MPVAIQVMKRLFILLCSCVIIYGCNQEEIANINARLDALENTKISSIDEQISKINVSIDNLWDLTNMLSAKDAQLGKRITALENYVNEQLPLMKEWAIATFSTLEQYQQTCDALAQFAVEFGKMDDRVNQAIETSNESIKTWVNGKLSGYWTIAEVQAKLNTLSQKDDNNLNTLRSELKEAKENLTNAYQTEISNAIEASEGRLSSRIDEINQQLQSKISSIESRLATIEKRLEDLEKQFDIVIPDAEGLACMPGKSLQISYTFVNSIENCQVECIGENGWSAKVVDCSVSGGVLIITAPETGVNGKILVIARSGNKLAMKALCFESGVLNIPEETYYVGWQGDEINVPVETNINYTVDCGNCDWISFIERTDSKASLRTDYYTLSIKENPEDSPARTAEIKFLNEIGQQVISIVVYQELSATSDPIVFADSFAKLVCVEKYDLNGDGELSYFEAGKVTSLGANFFGEYTPAVTSFDELQYFVSLEEISKEAFSQVKRLVSVKLPPVKKIGDEAFSGCSNLKGVVFPETLEIIGNGSFQLCESLSDINFPKSLKVISAGAFDRCISFKSILLNDGLEVLGGGAFSYCYHVEKTYVPESIKSIGSGAFCQVTGIVEIHGIISDGQSFDSGPYARSSFSEIIIGDDVTKIGIGAFYQIYNTTKIVVGKNVERGGFNPWNTTPVYYYRRFLPAEFSAGQYSKIFVPRGSKEIYMAAKGWPSDESVYEEYDVE